MTSSFSINPTNQRADWIHNVLNGDFSSLLNSGIYLQCSPQSSFPSSTSSRKLSNETRFAYFVDSLTMDFCLDFIGYFISSAPLTKFPSNVSFPFSSHSFLIPFSFPSLKRFRSFFLPDLYHSLTTPLFLLFSQ